MSVLMWISHTKRRGRRRMSGCWPSPPPRMCGSLSILLSVPRQEKERKKKKEWLLALTATKDVPVYAKLYLLKQTTEKVKRVIDTGTQE